MNGNRRALFAAALTGLLVLAGLTPADAGTLTVQAGSKHAGSFGLEVTPDATPTYVQTSHPSAEKTYRVRFYVNLTRINLSTGTSFTLFSAYDGADPLPAAAPAGNPVLRAAVRQVGANKFLDVFTRNDSPAEVAVGSYALFNGWREVELNWAAATAPAANNGFVNVWVNGVAQTGLATIDSDTQVINYSRWGGVTGATLGTPPVGVGVNTFRLDDFGSQRTGYLGQVQVFGDVPLSNPFFPWIQGLYSMEVTSGCGGGNYCPASSVTREQMAVFLERSSRGALFTPPAATGTVFTDVPLSNPFAAYIEQLAADGITSGCGGGNYCPASNVTRDQMAVFLLRAKYGSGYTPPAPTGTVFADVPLSNPYVAFIERLAAEGITTGCGGGNYCPTSNVTRDQMAIFLVRTFSFPTQEVGP